MSLAPYTPPAEPGEPWNRSYPRAWWDNRDRNGPSRPALNRAYDRLIGYMTEKGEAYPTENGERPAVSPTERCTETDTNYRHPDYTSGTGAMQ